jgi:hypothetical protein
MPETTPTPTKPTRDKTIYLAIIALVISIFGTGISIVEAGILRDQQQLMLDEKAAAVWPYVKGNQHISETALGMEISLSYKNKGIGPAIIQVETLFNGLPIENTLKTSNPFKGLNPDVRVIKVALNNAKLEILRPEETLEVYSFTLLTEGSLKDSLVRENMIAILEQLTTEVQYCSIYGECWEITQETGDRPEKCDGCAEELRIR